MWGIAALLSLFTATVLFGINAFGDDKQTEVALIWPLFFLSLGLFLEIFAAVGLPAIRSRRTE